MSAIDTGRDPSGQALVSDQAAARLDPPGFDPSRDPYWDYEENECWNCGGEGFVYGCSWDWQCDTYDEGEGHCLCTRRCDWCNPSKPDPKLQAVLAEALDRDSDGSGEAGETRSGSTEGDSAGPEGIAQPSECTCPYDERPHPCQHRYALSECRVAALLPRGHSA